MGKNPKTSSGYWQQADQFGALITETMIANAIDANGISAREILLKYDGDVSHGYIGGMCDSQSETFTGQVTKEKDLIIWAGDSKIDENGKKVGVGGAANDVVGKNATFKVYADGRVVCSGVDSKINGLATSTSEVYVDLEKLPQQKYDYAKQIFYYFDFTQYGTNVVITDSLADSYKEINGENYERYLYVDFPAYLFMGHDITSEHHETNDTFRLRGISTKA